MVQNQQQQASREMFYHPENESFQKENEKKTEVEEPERQPDARKQPVYQSLQGKPR
jgi:hypothetical protein